MTEEPKVVIRDGQWLGSGDLFADHGSKEVIVTLDSDAIEHPKIKELPDNEHGQSVQSSREALHRASEVASLARRRGSVDADGRIVVTGEDVGNVGTQA